MLNEEAFFVTDIILDLHIHWSNHVHMSQSEHRCEFFALF